MRVDNRADDQRRSGRTDCVTPAQSSRGMDGDAYQSAQHSRLPDRRALVHLALHSGGGGGGLPGHTRGATVAGNPNRLCVSCHSHSALELALRAWPCTPRWLSFFLLPRWHRLGADPSR
ncbi:hypothetical protein P4O66_014954, partial [Electrophorus voltai]